MSRQQLPSVDAGTLENLKSGFLEIAPRQQITSAHFCFLLKLQLSSVVWGAKFGLLTVGTNDNIVRPMTTNAPASLYETLTVEFGLTERDITAHLPPLLGTIARSIGLLLTVELIEVAQGRQIYVPETAEKDTLLTRTLGVNATAHVIEIVGGSRHVTVSNPFGARFMLRQKAMQAIKEGWSLNQVASHFGVSFNTVRNWRNLLGSAVIKKKFQRHPQRDVALAMLCDGKKPYEVARETGVHPTTVYDWKRQYEAAA